MNVKDFNTIELGDLIKLPGIGNKTALGIMLRREKYPFNTPEDLLKVDGVGKATLIKNNIDLPARQKRKKGDKAKMMSWQPTINHYKKPWREESNNTKVRFYQSLVERTCHRPDIVQSKTLCSGCPFTLICTCKLKRYVGDNGKPRTTPTQKQLEEFANNINKYHHFKLITGSPDYENMAVEFN